MHTLKNTQVLLLKSMVYSVTPPGLPLWVGSSVLVLRRIYSAALTASPLMAVAVTSIMMLELSVKVGVVNYL